jgi:hypothetical protein
MLDAGDLIRYVMPPDSGRFRTCPKLDQRHRALRAVKYFVRQRTDANRSSTIPVDRILSLAAAAE